MIFLSERKEKVLALAQLERVFMEIKDNDSKLELSFRHAFQVFDEVVRASSVL